MNKIIVRNGKRLNSVEIQTILDALHLAAQQYEKDENSVLAGERILMQDVMGRETKTVIDDPAVKRLARAFADQRRDALQLIEQIEDTPGGLVLDLTEEEL